MPYRSPEANYNFPTSSSQLTNNIPRYTPKPLLFAPSGPKSSSIGFDLSKEMGSSSSVSNRSRLETPRPEPTIKSPNSHQRNLSHNTTREKALINKAYPTNNLNEMRSTENIETPTSYTKKAKSPKTLPTNLGKTHRKLASFSGFSKSLNSVPSSMASTIPSNNNASQKIKVAIIFNQSFTVAGTELTGHIEFTCLAKDSVRAADIHLDLIGVEELSSSLNSSQSTFRLDHGSPSKSKIFYRTRLLIQDKDHPCPLARESGKPDSEGYWPLRRGKTTMPFLLRLASTLPNAMSTPLGRVFYNLELTVNHKSGIFKEVTGFSRGVNILERWEPKEVQAYRQRGVRAETRKKLFMGGQRHLEMSAELVASLVVAGSLAYVRITVKNPTSKKVQGIRMKLMQRLDKIELDSPSQEISEKIFNDADVKFPAGETRHCLLAMEIPSHCLSLRHTSLLHVDYTFQIILISSLSKDLVIDLPIYISHPASWNDPCPSLFSSSNPEMQVSASDDIKDINVPLFASPQLAATTSDSMLPSASHNQIIFETQIDPEYNLTKTHRPLRTTSEEHLDQHFLTANVQENRPHSSFEVENKAESKKPTFMLNPKPRAPPESLASGSSFPFSVPISLNTTNVPETPLNQSKVQSPSELSRVVSPPSFFRNSKAEPTQTRSQYLATPEPKIDSNGEFMVVGGRKYQLVSSSAEQPRPHTVSIPDQPYQIHNRKSQAVSQDDDYNTSMRHSSYISDEKQKHEDYRQNEINISPQMSPRIQDTGFEPWCPISAADEFHSELSSVYGFMEPSVDGFVHPRIIPINTYSETNPVPLNEPSSKASPGEEQYHWASENQNPRMNRSTHHSTEELERRSWRKSSIKHKNSVRVRTRGPIRRSIVPPTKTDDNVAHDDTVLKNSDSNDKINYHTSSKDNSDVTSQKSTILSTGTNQETMESQLNQLQQQMAILLQTFQSGSQAPTSRSHLVSHDESNHSSTHTKTRVASPSPPSNPESASYKPLPSSQEPVVTSAPEPMTYQIASRPKKLKKKIKAPLSKSRALQHHLDVLNSLHEAEDDPNWI